jgi:hypothetical protein
MGGTDFLLKKKQILEIILRIQVCSELLIKSCNSMSFMNVAMG